MGRDIFLFVILFLFSNSPGVLGQITQTLRKFPPLFNVAQNRPVVTEPSESTCGTSVRNAFCKSSTFPTSVEQCVQDFCVQTCPGRTLLPPYYSLLPSNGGFSDCIIADTVNIRPGSLFGSFSTYFLKSGPSCFLTPANSTGVSTSGEFTITVWIWQEESNKGTLLQKISQTTGEIIYQVLVERSGPTFLYRSKLGLATVTFKDEILPKVWKHLAIQVNSDSISFFINGIGPSFSAAYTVSLVSQVQDESPAWVRVGQTLSGTDQFLGRIQDFHFYDVTLSNREIAEDYSEVLPALRVQSSCRCPSAYPRVSPLQVHYCIKNGVPDNTENDVLRLNPESHPLEYVNDGDSNSIWISNFLSQANVIIDLGDEFQVFYVVIQFYSPLPMAVKIERQMGTTLIWDTWQMYAEDCMTYFSVSNDGPLPTPASVNCLKFPSQTPYSKGNITLNILSSEPVARPGYKDFYNTPDLYQFVRAKKIRIQMTKHYYIKNERQEYYGLYEVIISGRCDCNGHAETCNYTSLPYKCNCSEESHTEGRMCERCMPLFNDKPFRYGDNINLFPCRPCNCYGHADSCVYNITLDPFPNDHFSGGGGICVACKHNTIGQFCDTCINLYYRPMGKSKYDVDVCAPCNCFVGGVKNNSMDCQKDGGQCLCKKYVVGRQCSACAAGYYNLTVDNPDGCVSCECHLAGSQNANISCHPTSGMCNCKVNVRNNKCDVCQFGYYNLSATNPFGCSPCSCNPLGSTSQFCDSVSGQCQCKDNIIGQLCDTCADGYYDFWGLCRPCDCDSKGTELNTFCDKQTGQCQCKANVRGLRCDKCKEKSFGFGLNQRTGCMDCTCDTAGTVNGSNFCDNVTGVCACKSKVQGNNCNICKPNTWGLNASNTEGCIPCNCDPSGTQNGNISDPQSLPCDQNTGQCTCLIRRWGRQCDDCRDGYYVNPAPGGGCFMCDCDDVGTTPQTYCNTKTGQCQCRGGNSGVTGKSCNQCLAGYYGFQPTKGICSLCDCIVAGSKNLTCNSVTGQCQCKEFVTGRGCDTCVSGTSFLDAENSYGCSKAPAQQPQPYHDPLGPTTLSLYWQPPDNPNGVIKSYKLYRNRTLIFTPGANERKFNDTGLIPYTVYEYIIEAFNAFGSVNSTPVAYRTLAGPPSGIISLNITNIRSKSATFRWDEPAMRNGPYIKYKLLAQTAGSTQTKLLWEGTTTETYVSTLIPFTNYSFYVNACTDGGCLQSKGYTVSTQSSVPEGMRSPNIATVSSSQLYIAWSPPDQPNGIIIFYELWMRGQLGSDGIRKPPETRIFHTSGQYNPRPTLTPGENTLPAPDTKFTVGGLEPFTMYDFQVLAENDAGKAASPWISGQTGEALPVSMLTPEIMSVSSSELNITWRTPSASEAMGVISLYRVHYYQKTNLTTFPYAPPYMWILIYNTSGSKNFYVMRGLSPYSNYTFKIEACNSIGCVNSTAAIGRTQQAVPEGLTKPIVRGYNSTVMEIIWLPPAFPNGPDPEYTIEKTIPALSYPPQVIRGTRFPGGGYYLFPPDTLTPNVPFTGIQFWFRTRERDGLLLFGASDGKQEEFVALQFRAGRPWFIFDPQGCPTFVQLDPLDDKLSTLTFVDGEWHRLYIFRNETIATLVVDDQYTGCVSFISPTNDEGLSYNDNLWHRMLAWRNETTAYISVDDTWTGTRQVSCAQGSVIGPLTGVYVGGIPASFKIRREDKDPRVQPLSYGFQGCIRDIQIMTQKFPTEVWKTLDWNDAITNELAFLNWEGCPINLDHGIHFMGKGFARFSTSTVQIGNNKDFKFGFRTQMHTGILFFSYGAQGVYVYAALIKGALHFEFSNGIYVGGATFNWNDVNLCDSRWYTVQLSKKGQQASIAIDGIGTETRGDPNVILNVYVMSEFYIGGIPPNAEASRFINENKLSIPMDAFGGCIRDFTQDSFMVLDFRLDSTEVVNVNMDGCTPFHMVQETCVNDLIHQVYKGNKTQVYDVNLDPYTDYLYHLQATNLAGTATSLWGYGRTKEGANVAIDPSSNLKLVTEYTGGNGQGLLYSVYITQTEVTIFCNGLDSGDSKLISLTLVLPAPIGMLPPTGTRSISGYVVEVTWRPPISTAGLLTRYELQGYNLDNTTIDPIIIIITNTSMLIGNLTKTIPYTNYLIKIVACTDGGCASHQDGINIRTNEEAPENVSTPTAVAGPSYLIVKWGPPANPNGPITGNFLFQDDVLIYSGGETFFNVTNLQVYTAYRFYVRTCTRIGCTNGSTVALSTSQLPPTYMKPPRLLALGTRSVETRWEQPEQLNGVLQRYILYTSVNKSLIGEEVYNNTDFFLDYVISNLTAGTTYYIRVAACTGGGCRVSEPSNITTQESSPEGVQPPVVTSPSPTELNVTWMEPSLPNGKIIQYELYLNEVPTYKGIGMNYLIGSLRPYSLNSLRVAACTSRGCGSSTLVQFRTQEAPPVGFIVMEMTVNNSRTINVRWTKPESPNGDLFYDVFAKGLFYADIVHWNYATVSLKRSMYHGKINSQWVEVSPLIPMSTYLIQINASNLAGFLLSNELTAVMPAGTPDGVMSPNLISQTPTTITATWSAVGRKNSAEDPNYVLQFREIILGAQVIDVFGPTTAFTYTKENLIPFRKYEFRLVASNTHGSSFSEWVSQVTRQDRPIGVDPPLIAGVGSRHIDITWTPPLTPNGIIMQYKIYQNNVFREMVLGNVTSMRTDELLPYTSHAFQVEACTLGGCTKSSESARVRTLEDIPEGIYEPLVVSRTPASVEIRWSEPSMPNGLISLYGINRRLNGTYDFTTVTTVAASSVMAYVDESSELSPYTSYQYQLAVTNGAGVGYSPWVTITTKSTRPSGVLAPLVRILSPTMMNVSWDPPLHPNGLIEFYAVQLPEQRLEIRNISQTSILLTNLTPYTEYSVNLTVCTDGGCTESPQVFVRTYAMVPEGQLPPIATPVSQSIISVVWQSPSRPNGPNIQYELSRIKTRQPLDSSATGFNLWERIYKGTSTAFEDRGLTMYTTYRYRVTVYNDVGQMTSEPTANVSTFGGFPRQAAVVTGYAINHLSVAVSWITPNEVELQGSVTEYTIKAMSNLQNFTQTVSAGKNNTIIQNLTPNTDYRITVTITINGGATITSEPIIIHTKDGAPVGLKIPILSIISETALRVSWIDPDNPNGEITGYNIYVNGKKIETGMVYAGSYVIKNLLPYTVYVIQLEVCTVFVCVKSAEVLGSTVEALPQGVASPTAVPISATNIHVMWTQPYQPNGIILRYDLYRKYLTQCSQIPTTTPSPEFTKCTFIECGILENLCGTICYSGAKVCCDGVLYASVAGYDCCGTQYVPRSFPSDVCCGGMFHTRMENYQCCGQRYEKVLPGQVCCLDQLEDRVAIGYGDACCGSIPYSFVGAQICCADKLLSAYQQQCCGGEVVSDLMVCCGGFTDGKAFTPMENNNCCGYEYVEKYSTLCCTADTGDNKAHHYSSPDARFKANEKCCGLEKISNSLSCCNFVGYNPLTHVCADVSKYQDGCGTGTVCPLKESGTAFCNRCNFNQSAYMCGSVSGHFDPQAITVSTPSPTDSCVVSVDRIYSGLEMDYIDKELNPYSHYEYAVSAVNSAGSTQSGFTSAVTQQAQPQGLDPPRATVDPTKLNVIYLSWKLPVIPNGEILRFILTRDGIELYRGLDVQFSDDTNIMPFRSYTYMLSACTVAGCVTSEKITIATAQAPPEDMLPPKLVVVNDTTIQASWTPPAKPNGIIQLFTFYIFGANQSKAFNTTGLSITVTDLKPYSKYSTIIQVCNDIGCTGSNNVTIKTPEGQPAGLDPPDILVASSTSIDIFWSPPDKPNGEILFYGLIRSDQNKLERIYMGKGDNFHKSDYGLTPGVTYQYFLIMGNSVGNITSGYSAVTMPYRLPSNIPPPKNVTVLSATEIYVEWNYFSSSEGFIDQYRVLLNPGRPDEVIIGVGFNLSRKVTGLIPFTTYDVRVQGCLQDQPLGCGSSPGILVQTYEAPPDGLAGPHAKSVASNIVDISWEPPKFPNGIITQYLVYYKTSGSGIELLINRVDGETFQVRHAGPELKPFFEYEYKVVGGNSKGDVSSSWTRVRTLEAPPTGLLQPLVTVTGAFSINLQWQHPAQPNGIITKYTFVYRIVERDPTVPMMNLSLNVIGNTTNTSISGLRPYADYQLQLQAFNGAGSTATSWANFKTNESSPSGLGLFDIEKIDTGTSAILRWGAPVHPNGIITTYRIYEASSSVAVFQGLNQQFELRRLQPYTDYTVQLEACTTAGCTRSVLQTFRSAEIPPTDQSSPVMGKVTSSTVSLTWTRPGNANGLITMYEVLRKSNPRIKKRSLPDPVVVYRTMDTAAGSYQYTDTNLQPFTEYQYSIRAVNSQGSTQSQWQTAFTQQAPPDGVDPPIVTYLDSNVNALNIRWVAPLKPNGIIQSYQLQRNGSVLFSFSPMDKKEFNDTGLTAYTWYNYTVTVCSGGGCTTSDPTLFRTKESAPLSVAPPTVVAINSTAIRVTWAIPQITNGEISIYQLKMDGIIVFEGLQLLYVLGNLMPYHEYSFVLIACTKGGCVESGQVIGSTEDASPQGILPPVLRVMSATSIEVSWLPPEFPNGIITSYDVRRDGRLIYTQSISSTGFLSTTYMDYNLNPGTKYSYVVTARNRKGSTESTPSLALTFSSSPSGLDPPTLHPLTATSIQAIWHTPVSPNGVIKNYTLYRDGGMVYAGGPEQLSYIVPGLQFWTEYSFRVQACTDRGCQMSTPASARTLEAIPEGQRSPQLRALADQNGAHTGILVTWESPLKPNGIVKAYEVYRRQLTKEGIGVSYSPTKLVYNGSQLQYTDKSNELQPFMDYQYSVTSVNSVGKVASLWETVQTKQASPAAVLPPIVMETTLSTISVTITPPAVPNGVVYIYNVLVNGTVGSQGTSLNQTVGLIQPLAPYTVYSLTIQACTAGGCTTSPWVIGMTKTDHPTGQEPVRVLDVNSTSVKLAWSHPARPNGQISSFLLYQRIACPPTSQPFDQSCITGQPKKVYEGLYIEMVITSLSVYTAYEFQVMSATSAGVSDFPVWVRVETGQTDPEYVKLPVLNKNSSIAVINWSLSFMLNGRLKEYILLRDEQDVFHGISTYYELDMINKNTVVKLTIKAVTASGQAESPLIIFDPSTADNIGITTSSSQQGMTADKGQNFYKEVWFIVLIVIAVLILLFSLCALCMRRAAAKQPYIRERLPLKEHQKRSEHPFSFCFDNNDGSIFTTENQHNERTALEFYDNIGVRYDGVVNPAFASGTHITSGKLVGLDKRSTSTSQFDNESDNDEFLWEKTADSGLYDDDMDSLRTPSYSITKEQTVFTDTHL